MYGIFPGYIGCTVSLSSIWGDLSKVFKRPNFLITAYAYETIMKTGRLFET